LNYLNVVSSLHCDPGFTAWSSMREPAQVFTLLETLYSAFDELAKELGVFKVETVRLCTLIPSHISTGPSHFAFRYFVHRLETAMLR
jgi:Adenylate and Guanylate cyclase catalytic domain